MGGDGRRFGGDIPKQFSLLQGKKVFEYPYEAIERTGIFDEIVLVSHPKWILSKEMVPGGKTRQESSYIGLQAFKIKPDIVLIHDAVRPFVSATLLEENVKMAIRHGAVDTCIETMDTLVYAPNRSTIEKIPDRASFYRGQTPQTFQYKLISAAHEQAKKKNASDDCQLVLDMGRPVHIVPGSELNIKITTENDIKLAKSILNSNYLTH